MAGRHVGDQLCALHAGGAVGARDQLYLHHVAVLAVPYRLRLAGSPRPALPPARGSRAALRHGSRTASSTKSSQIATAWEVIPPPPRPLK